MPLHLLGKKSWNVYDSKNIARVKRDEAEAAAQEAEEERRMQDVDNERKLAILRGEEPPQFPPVKDESDRKRHAHDERPRDHGRERKRRRLAGEDDTERDIRFAREDLDQANGARERLGRPQEPSKNAPIVDREGLMDLFPEEMPAAQKNALQRAEENAAKKRREKEQEEQMSMRFADAAGKAGLKEDPWYKTTQDIGALIATGESNDVWGRPDPKRKDREQSRMASNDPFVMMQQAQKQLKRAQSDKAEWEERRRELKKLGREEEKRQRKESKKRRREEDAGNDDLEGFSLGAPSFPAQRDERLGKSYDRRHRNSDRSQERRHHGHHRHRSRSREHERSHRDRRHQSRDRRDERANRRDRRRRRSRSRDHENENNRSSEKYPLMLSPPRRVERDESRPEKSTAVASRMIAGALGMKAV